MKKRWIVILPNGAQVLVTAAECTIISGSAGAQLLFTTNGAFEARFAVWAGYGIED